jgi:hypothetical protein
MGASMGLLGPAGVAAGPPLEWISRELLRRIGRLAEAIQHDATTGTVNVRLTCRDVR